MGGRGLKGSTKGTASSLSVSAISPYFVLLFFLLCFIHSVKRWENFILLNIFALSRPDGDSKPPEAEAA